MLSIGDFARLGQVSPRMLRHYDELDLLRPERVDPVTGYRSYAVSQLRSLHRLVALRDLGFGLEQIKPLLDEELPVEELAGMLRLRRVQVAATVDDEQARLRRIEARLRLLEGHLALGVHDIVLKSTEPLRVATASGVAAGFGPPINPVLDALCGEIFAAIDRANVRAGMMVAWYDLPEDDGSVVAHAGFDIGDQPFDGDERVGSFELPVIEVASLIHRGSMETCEPVYEGLVQWIDDSGYRLAGASRELYREFNPADQTSNITELQMPVTR
jgi:DNA-binding transcriptional MerR regulator